MSRPTFRTYDVIIPMGTGSPVGPMFALFGLFVAAALFVMALVCFAFPSTDYPSVDVTPGAVPTSAVAPTGGAR
ncbi:hypothetical protein [Nocardia sp. NPDC059195]|uniref:hypothetical protein n=1 Tax=Nocardia sp. NPDC059195 TaxID=3346765 RepID=UPI0036C47BC1